MKVLVLALAGCCCCCAGWLLGCRGMTIWLMMTMMMTRDDDEGDRARHRKLWVVVGVGTFIEKQHRVAE